MKEEFTEIKYFPGQAVEEYRKTHGGHLPDEPVCPLCDGTGHPPFTPGMSKSQEAKELKKKGLTVREIQKVMGLSSSSLAQYYIKK